MSSAQLNRCSWCLGSEIYEQYHDKEWGVPVYDDNKQFEFLVLESAQAGLSWLTILKRRDGYRSAFADFEPKAVANFDEKKIQELLKDEGIIRNQLKVRAAVKNAQVFLEIQQEFGTFSKYIWSYVGSKPKQNSFKKEAEIPAQSNESQRLSQDLKKRGMKFVGPTIMYAHMQATGLVNDHIVSCFRYKELH